MFHLIYAAINMHEVTKEKLPCKTPYLFYSIYVPTDLPNYVS
jgi:hypothetical protein